MPPAILVTGASSGIGAALAEAFAGDGGRLVLVARSADGLAATAARVTARGGAAPLLLPLDLHRPDAVAQVEEVLDRAGLALDVLVNNAGFGLHGPAAELPRDRQLALIDLNVRAAAELALWALPRLLARGRGGILNVASVAGFLPGPYMAAYYASKAFLLSFSEALHEEVDASGVTVTALCPGPTRSDFGRRAGFRNMNVAERYGMMSAEEVARLAHRGFRRGDRVVLTGWRNRVGAALGRHVPRFLVLPAIARAQRIRAVTTTEVDPPAT